MLKLRQQAKIKTSFKMIGGSAMILSLVFFLQVRDDSDEVIQIKDLPPIEIIEQLPDNLTNSAEETEVEESLITETKLNTQVTQPSATAVESPTKSTKVSSTASWGAINFGFGKKGAELQWSMQAMQFADEFIVERSTNNITYNSLGTQKADEAFEYSFVDTGMDFLGMPRVYYRLKMKGLDGNSFYSPIKKVESSLKLGLYGAVEVNGREIHCMYAADTGGEIELVIENEQGEVLYEATEIADRDASNLNLKAKDWKPGTYTFLLKNTETEFRSDFTL